VYAQVIQSWASWSGTVILGTDQGQNTRTFKLTPHAIRPGGEDGADRGGAGLLI
jgi:hypothetical protein